MGPKGQPKAAKRQQREQKTCKSKGKGGGASSSKKAVRHDATSRVTKGDVRRIARRAGCQRMAGIMHGEAKDALRTFLQTVLKDVSTYTEAGKKKTVTPKEVIYSLRRQGRTI